MDITLAEVPVKAQSIIFLTEKKKKIDCSAQHKAFFCFYFRKRFFH